MIVEEDKNFIQLYSSIDFFFLNPDPYGPVIKPWSPQEAQEKFLERYEELSNAR